MQKIQQRELQKLKKLSQLKQKQQEDSLRALMDDDTIRISLKYAEQVLSSSEKISQNLSEYSPMRISQFVFQKQLNQLKGMFQKLPKAECKLQHFVIMMLRVMKFPFQKTPYFMIGLKDMFYEIAEEKAIFITFQMFFKYILGQIISLKDQQQNTEFQVRYEEQKKQDYLLHDTGVKKLIYSKDLKLYICLDERANTLKIYDRDMKIVSRFSPSRDKHGKKFPNIMNFDYNQLNFKLGLILSDSTFSIINFKNFLTKNFMEFQSQNSNQIVVPCVQNVTEVKYLQMMNRWAVITEENRLFLYDTQKFKQGNYIEEIKLNDIDIKISKIVEIIQTNTICLVAGNQVNFFSENMAERKWKKYQHPTDIKNFIYCEQKNQFYISGKEKVITILEVGKSSGQLHFKHFDTNSKNNIVCFQIFPLMDTIVLIDDKSQLRLYNQSKSTLYQCQAYKHINKNASRDMQILKTGKIQFTIFETYMLVFSQQKVSIERNVDYVFAPYTFYDEKKENFYISVNHQIIAFSVPHGQIRKNFSIESSNLEPHQAFMIGNNTRLFILDKQNNLYDIYSKDDKIEGENRHYKKKLNIQNVIHCFYDQPYKACIILTATAIYEIRNEGDNNFSVNGVYRLEKMPKIVSSCFRYPTLNVICQNQQIYQFEVADYSVRRAVEYKFPKDQTQHQDRLIIGFDNDPEFGFDIFLTNLNQVYLVSTQDSSNQFLIKVQDYLPIKEKFIMYNQMKYQKIGEGKNAEMIVLLYDDIGNLAEFDLKKGIPEFISSLQKPDGAFKMPSKDSKIIKIDRIKVNQIYLSNNAKTKLSKGTFRVFKAHDQAIKIAKKLKIQILVTLTISQDGFIKLWDGTDCLFNLKMPNLLKVAWNMSKIDDLKNSKSIKKVLNIIDSLKKINQFNRSPVKIMQKSKKMSKAKPETFKLNLNQPIPLEFQNKDLQEIVYENHNKTWSVPKAELRKKKYVAANMLDKIKTNPHPWREKRQFVKIIQKASPQNKYKAKIPKDLLQMRNSLDMTEKQKRVINIYENLVILPQINSYVPETARVQSRKTERQSNPEQPIQNFESCLYIKSKRNRKKINQFDEIDKQFKKKWLSLTQRRWIPRQKQTKSTIEEIGNQTKDAIYKPSSIGKQRSDPVRAVKEIFESHNRNVIETKRGRIIKVPKIDFNKDQLYF